jgi:RHS repeat-associated protein
MTTYRNESLGPASGDVTTWRYDEASNCMTNKVYADGKGPRYGYTPDGRLSQRIWARGIVTDYSYDGWNNLTNTTYSDGTPTVTLFYDAMGRQTNAVDAAGVTSFAYDQFGNNTNEAAALASIVRRYDGFGRNVGYNHSSGTVTSNDYDIASGRLTATSFDGTPFSYRYVPGADLEAAIAGPGFDKVVSYEPHRDLITEIAYTNSGLIASRSYGYDLGGNVISRTQKRKGEPDRNDFFVNDIRSQLTNAVIGADSYSYDYDDIGNRNGASERGTNTSYTANSLNQYTEISNLCDSVSLCFIPEFDDDGNQTLVKTVTGIWRVTYNGENRPINWTCGSTNIVMSYDRMGRRFEKTTFDNGTVVKSSRFAYDGYLQVAEYAIANGQTSIVTRTFWDPSHPIATRPLTIKDGTGESCYYAVDLTKNVCEVLNSQGDIASKYDYSAFGAITVMGHAGVNLFRWACEYQDDETGLVYYNYRHYEPVTGKWLSKDPIGEYASNLSMFTGNSPETYIDVLGLLSFWPPKKLSPKVMPTACSEDEIGKSHIDDAIFLVVINGSEYYVSADKQLQEWSNQIVDNALGKKVGKEISEGVKNVMDLISKSKKIADVIKGERKMVGLEELMHPANYLIEGFIIEFKISCCECENGKYYYKHQGEFSVDNGANPSPKDAPSSVPPGDLRWVLGMPSDMNSMTEQVRIAALSMVNYASNLCSKENSDRK